MASGRAAIRSLNRFWAIRRSGMQTWLMLFFQSERTRLVGAANRHQRTVVWRRSVRRLVDVVQPIKECRRWRQIAPIQIAAHKHANGIVNGMHNHGYQQIAADLIEPAKEQ